VRLIPQPGGVVPPSPPSPSPTRWKCPWQLFPRSCQGFLIRGASGAVRKLTFWLHLSCSPGRHPVPQDRQFHIMRTVVRPSWRIWLDSVCVRSIFAAFRCVCVRSRRRPRCSAVTGSRSRCSPTIRRCTISPIIRSARTSAPSSPRSCAAKRAPYEQQIAPASPAGRGGASRAAVQCNRPFCDGHHIGRRRDPARCLSRRWGKASLRLNQGEIRHVDYDDTRPVRGRTSVAWTNHVGALRHDRHHHRGFVLI
jgi:hypothetical protein